MTRLGVLSDIHGNASALSAVLGDLAGDRVDLLVNLGDIVSGPLDPCGTLDLLRAYEVVTVRGNHERHVVSTSTATLGASDRFAAERLSEFDLQRLQALPPTAEPAPGVLAFHGSPADDLCYLLETSTPDGLREATDDEVTDRLNAPAGRFELYLCGHTHLQRVRSLPDGSLVVNPGSVGMPAFSSEVPYPHVAESGTPTRGTPSSTTSPGSGGPTRGKSATTTRARRRSPTPTAARRSPMRSAPAGPGLASRPQHGLGTLSRRLAPSAGAWHPWQALCTHPSG